MSQEQEELLCAQTSIHFHGKFRVLWFHHPQNDLSVKPYIFGFYFVMLLLPLFQQSDIYLSICLPLP